MGSSLKELVLEKLNSHLGKKLTNLYTSEQWLPGERQKFDCKGSGRVS